MLPPPTIRGTTTGQTLNVALFKRRSDPGLAELVAMTALGFQQMMGMSARQARAEAEALVAEADRVARDAGDPPAGFGDDLLAAAQAGDPKAIAAVEKVTADGGSDDDIRWYWGMPPAARRLMEILAEQAQFAHFASVLAELAEQHPRTGQEELAKLAGDEVRQWHPLYGDPTDPSPDGPDDRPLANPLKDRIDRYLEAHGPPPRDELLSFSSFNAWARSLLRQGNMP